MELVGLCDELLTVLEQFDEAILPLGLYASDDLVENTKKSKPRRQEWYVGIAPYLKKQNYSVGILGSINPYVYRTWFYIPNVASINLTIVRFSKIKVRNYGASYKVDIHEDRAKRWKEVNLGKRISRLWKLPELETDRYIELLLLIGFDKAKDPLRRELLELQQSLKWETRDVVYLTRFWEDKAQRGFSVRLAAWCRFVCIDW